MILNQISKIILISDQHIRLYKRHKEYEQVFKKLYKYIDSIKDENTAIVLGGDLVHNKIEMTPELVRMASNFLKECADRCPTILMLGNHDCFTPDHDILTKTGWVNLKEYVDNCCQLEVATFNAYNKKIEFQTPLNNIKKHYVGDMIHFSGKEIDAIVTPTHSMLYAFSNGDGKLYKTVAEKLPKKCAIPVNGKHDNFKPDHFAELLGYSFADATFVLKNPETKSCRIQFHFKKKRKLEYITQLLEKNNYKFNVRRYDERIIICIYSNLAKDIFSFFDGKKEIPATIYEQNTDFLKSFLLGYLNGDGSKVNESSWKFVTISKQSADMLIAITRLVGGISHLSTRVIRGNFPNSKLQYSGFITLNDKINTTTIKQSQYIKYDGDVYCLEVPNTNLLIRRNDKIFITGNCNLSNQIRLDALTPIVESLNHPNLHYWKDSGVYKFGGVSFSVFSLLGNPTDWVPASELKSKYKIALFHGPVLSYNYNNPFIEEGVRTISINKFNGFDLVLLGDIHISNQLVQEYREENGEKFPAAKYPGSLIGQSFGEEPDGHGILIWDLKTRTSEFVPIENEYCYYTLNVIDNKYDFPKKLPKKVRLRVKYENSSIEIVNGAIEQFAKKYTIVELTRQKVSIQNSSSTSATAIGNSRDVNYQNQLIEEYFKGQEIDKETIQDIKRINIECNQIFKTQNILRNITWKPKVLEFSNMFSYGENNVVDFTDMNGVYSINSPNGEGKSAFLDILCFSIYDKSTRASKAIHILNNNKTTFKCKFNFEFNGREFFIERIGTKNEKTNAVRVDVNFWTIDEDGEIKSLNGEDRDQTNKTIREYLGTYDDFVMTALSTQYDNQSFVEKTQRERKELLYKFLDIGIYDELYKAAKDQTKEQQTLIKEFERENLYDKGSEINTKILFNTNKVAELSGQIDANKTELKSINGQIFELNKQIQSVQVDLKIEVIEDHITKNKTELLNIVSELTNYKEQLKSIEIEQKKLQKQLGDVDIERFISDKTLETELKSKQAQLVTEERKIHELRTELVGHRQKVAHLETHQYDPTCKFCCDNKFVADAKNSLDRIPNLESLIEVTALLVNVINDDLVVLNDSNTERAETIKLINKLSGIQNTVNLLREQIQTTKYKGQTLKEKTKYFEIQRTNYYHNENVFLNNIEIEKTISDLKISLSSLEKAIDKLEREHRSVFGNLSSQKKEYDIIQVKLQQYNELIKNNRVYELYTQALGRDGVPYLILEKILPLIEFEVNEVLSQIVNFTVRLESTEEKYIHAYIDYGNNQTWPVELTSGMERFILSLAFRTSLTEITSLPRPPFLAIDEGFGVLDSDNLLAMGKMFEFLKTRYNYLLVISHIESMKDLVERRISVQKVNGYSTINVEEN